jgi:hypothetical protein
VGTIKRTKKRTKKKTAKRGEKRGGTRAPVEVVLPDKPSELSDDFRDYSMLLHGDKKIGKTSLLAQEPGAYFLEFDPEQRALAILQSQMPDWRTFAGYLNELTVRANDGTLAYRTLVIDGVDIMYEACFHHMCKVLGIEHPHDENDYGKSWGKIRSEYERAVRQALNLPGVAPRFICHSQWKEIKTRGGGETEKLVPILKKQAEEVLVGLVDIWAAYTYDGRERVLVIKGDEQIGAGHRVDHKFRTPSGELVYEVPMGNSAEQAYDNLLSAWNNEQTFADLKSRDVEGEAKKGGARKKVGRKKKKSK